MNINRKIDVLGRVVIPAEFRNSLGLVEGDEVSVSTDNGVIILTPTQKVCKLCGSHENVKDGKICEKCITDYLPTIS